MKTLFVKLLSTGFSAGWLILAILLLRVLLKRVPRRLICLLWALAAIRLICPVFVESAFSLIPDTQPVYQRIILQLPQSAAEGPAQTELSEEIDADGVSETASDAARSVDLLDIAAGIWCVGAIGLAAYAVAGSLAMKKRLAPSICIRSNLYSCDYIRAPFIFGVLHPRVYLPSGMEGEELAYVLAHEQVHLKRKDYLWKPLGFLLLAVYWVNPLMWIAYRVFCRDVELACDEAVVRNLDHAERAGYARALLHYSGTCAFAVSPLAFGEKDVKQRFQSVLRYQKPSAWRTGVGIVALMAMVVCFLTNPVAKAEENTPFPVGDIQTVLFVGQDVSPENGVQPAEYIVLADLNQSEKTVSLTSIPLNTSVSIPVYEDSRGDYHVTRDQTLSVWSMLGLGWDDSIGVMNILRECVSSYLDVPVDGCTLVTPEAAIAFVDGLGGIDISLDEAEVQAMTQSGDLPENASAGTHHLTGRAALAYARLSIPGEDEGTQTQRQQLVMQAIFTECGELSANQLRNLVADVSVKMVTDLEETELENYLSALLSLFGSSGAEMQSAASGS